jgi:hypothetical protein
MPLDSLPLSDFQEKLRQISIKTPSPGKHAARNAIVHLQKAWELRKVDPAMAVFRGITADEESATAVFHALKHRHYQGAAALNPHRHDQKAAMLPFLLVLNNALVGMMPLQPTIILRKPASKLPRILLRFSAYDSEGEKYSIEPEPPLHGIVSVNGQPCDFSTELEQLATRQNAKSISEHIRRLANYRNRILYASPRGIPDLSGLRDEFFFQTRARVFRNLGIYLFITEYSQRQDFVQQALNAFLKMMGRLPERTQE